MGLTFRLGQHWRIFEFLLRAWVFANRWIHGVQVVVENYIYRYFTLFQLYWYQCSDRLEPKGFEGIDKLVEMKKD
jgi:hypothetical protein